MHSFRRHLLCLNIISLAPFAMPYTARYVPWDPQIEPFAGFVIPSTRYETFQPGGSALYDTQLQILPNIGDVEENILDDFADILNLLTPQHRHSPFYNVTTRFYFEETWHRIAYDSIIVSKAAPWTEHCKYVQNLGTTFHYCNFNQLFICDVLGKYVGWHGFNSNINMYWYRTPSIAPWKMGGEWNYVSTRNRHVIINMRFGKYNDDCTICMESYPQKCTERVLKWGPEFEETGLMIYHRAWVSATKKEPPITCIQVLPAVPSKHSVTTCDIKQYTDAPDGARKTFFTTGVHPYDNLRLHLPAEARNTIDATNMETPPSNPVSITIPPDIPECKAGFQRSFNGLVNSCESFFSTKCNSRPDANNPLAVVTGCTDAHIYERCVGVVPIGPCLTIEINLCQEMRIRRMNIAVNNDFETPRPRDYCVSITAYCGSDAFFDFDWMETLGLNDIDEPDWAGSNIIYTPPATGSLRSGCRKCTPLKEFGSDGYFPDDVGVPHNNPYQCKGAYPGRPLCNGAPRRIVAGFDGVSQFNVTRNYLAVEESLEKPHPARSYVCKECDNICPGGSHVTKECGTAYIDNGAGLVAVDSENLQCQECPGSCQPGEYRACNQRYGTNGVMNPEPKDDRFLCAYCKCAGGNNCDDIQTHFCLVNVTECDGSTFTPEKNNACTAFAAVTCPRYQYRRSITEIPGYEHVLYVETMITKIKEHVCVNCVHPGGTDEYTPPDKCDTGKTWLGCIENGIAYTDVTFGTTNNTNMPVCEFCDDLEPNSYFIDISISLEECAWGCNSGYYRKDDICMSCTDRSPCEQGFMADVCPKNQVGEPGCVRCLPHTFASGVCSDNHYLQDCDGSGFKDQQNPPIESTQRCEPCMDEEAFKSSFGTPEGNWEYKECGDNPDKSVLYNSDPSGYVQCGNPTFQGETGAPLNSEWASESSTCDFVCNAGYYKNGGYCVQCNTKETRCPCGEGGDEISCDAYVWPGCPDRGTTENPSCVCADGYIRQGAYGGGCVPCTDYRYSNSGMVTCDSCPGGYSGNAEIAATDCVPCEVNFYRARPNSIRKSIGKCRSCDAGTDGLIGSPTCRACTNPDSSKNGLKAILHQWTGFLWNFAKLGCGTYTSSPSLVCWIPWVGVPPTICDASGTNATIQVCSNQEDYQSIRWVGSLPDDGRDIQANGVGEYENIWFTCGPCAGGLAYSANFDYQLAFANRY